jgi:hypothetical protein
MSRTLPNLINDYAIIQGEDWNYQKHTAIAFPYGEQTLTLVQPLITATQPDPNWESTIWISRAEQAGFTLFITDF